MSVLKTELPGVTLELSDREYDLLFKKDGKLLARLLVGPTQYAMLKKEFDSIETKIVIGKKWPDNKMIEL